MQKTGSFLLRHTTLNLQVQKACKLAEKSDFQARSVHFVVQRSPRVLHTKKKNKNYKNVIKSFTFPLFCCSLNSIWFWY